MAFAWPALAAASVGPQPPDPDGGNAVGVADDSNAACCPVDFDCDGDVDQKDWPPFAFAYDLLLCDDPAMQPGCPADMNFDTFVDDTDFLLFAAAYNAYFCP